MSGAATAIGLAAVATLALLVAGCATPSQLKRGPSAPRFVGPVPAAPIGAYAVPIPHEAPRSDPGAKP